MQGSPRGARPVAEAAADLRQRGPHDTNSPRAGRGPKQPAQGPTSEAVHPQKRGEFTHIPGQSCAELRFASFRAWARSRMFLGQSQPAERGSWRSIAGQGNTDTHRTHVMLSQQEGAPCAPGCQLQPESP